MYILYTRRIYIYIVTTATALKLNGIYYTYLHIITHRSGDVIANEVYIVILTTEKVVRTSIILEKIILFIRHSHPLKSHSLIEHTYIKRIETRSYIYVHIAYIV